MSPQPSLVIEEFADAEDFLQALSPLDQARWPERTYIYRGQPDAKLPLTASARRQNGRITAKVIYGDEKVEGLTQVAFEIDVLQRFLDSCDRSGLSVAGDSAQLRSYLDAKFTEMAMNPEQWPPHALHQVLAVAQHHGVPTCLLDWSRRSYVAAYFAASAALSSQEEVDKLAVWALKARPGIGLSGPVSVVELPGGTSQNLAAQAGVFTVSRIEQGPDAVVQSIGLDDEESIQRHQLYLRKLTLPFSEAPRLLYFCHQLGVSASVLFPGFEGVAKEVHDLVNMERWERVLCM